MTSLRVAFCSHDAAKFAVERWHYSGCLPTGKLVKVGVWEDDEFVGVVLFSRGASPWLGVAYDLDHVEICELTRIAMRRHSTPVSKVVAEALALLRDQSPELRLVVSFADPSEGHHGGIYQAGNWIYTGRSNEVVENFVRGKWRHVRGSYHEAKAAGGVPTRTRPGKHRYLMPLDRAMRRRLLPSALPYPRPAVEVSDGETPPFHGGGVGSIPADRSTGSPSSA